MTKVAKVFIVINFVLSIVYMTVAGTLLAQKWDYKQWFLKKENEYQAETGRLNDQIKDLDAKVANMRDTLRERTERAITSQNLYEKEQLENEKLRRNIYELNGVVSNFETDLKKLNGYLDGKEERIGKLEASKDQAKQEKEEAIKARESAQDELEEVKLQLANLEGKLSEQEQLIQRTQKDLWEAKQVIRTAKELGYNIKDIFKKEPPMDGFITVVSKVRPLVMLSVGKDDGVKKGFQFTVYRKDKYIGRIVVDEVYKDSSAARILKSMTKRAIRKSDRVTTRIGRTGG